MKVTILEEHGHENALLGLSLSFYDHVQPLETWWDATKKLKADKRADLLSHKQGGHNKYLEAITVTLYIQAARSFWSEFDTYRVGMTKQSSSTMHTLDKRPVTVEDFEEGTSQFMIYGFNQCLDAYRNPEHKHYKDVTILKNNLPEGWLQERVVVTNYKTLQNIYFQRHEHRLKYWKQFCKDILEQLQYPQYIKPSGV